MHTEEEQMTSDHMNRRKNKRYLIVGTANGSKESNSSKSMGTEMRPGDNTKKSQIQLFIS